MDQSKTFCGRLGLLTEYGIPLIAEFERWDRDDQVITRGQSSDFVSAFLIRANGTGEAPRQHALLEALWQNDHDVVFDGFAMRVRDCSRKESERICQSDLDPADIAGARNIDRCICDVCAVQCHRL